jgi:hypothetical protein
VFTRNKQQRHKLDTNQAQTTFVNLLWALCQEQQQLLAILLSVSGYFDNSNNSSGLDGCHFLLFMAPWSHHQQRPQQLLPFSSERWAQRPCHQQQQQQWLSATAILFWV